MNSNTIPPSMPPITQDFVNQIIARAQASLYGLDQAEVPPLIARYEPPDLANLANALITGWHAKYDLISVVGAALQEVAELMCKTGAEAIAWQEEIRGAIQRSGMGIMRTSQGPSGTMIGYRPEVEENHNKRTLEVIRENCDLTAEVKNLQKRIAELDNSKTPP